MYEHVTGGGMAGVALPDRLAREGEMMVRAVLADLAGIPDVETIAIRDDRLPPWNADPAAHCFPCDRQSAEAIFDNALYASDAVWLIAPETGRVLERLAQRVLAADKRLLGSRPEAIAMAASKRCTAVLLEHEAIQVVPTFRAAHAPAGPGPWVVKPDDGVGCAGARLLSDAAALQGWLHERHDLSGYVVQPFVPGQATSLSMLCCDGRAWLLSCNVQHISIEAGVFRLTGCGVNAIAHRRREYAVIADRIAAAMPALWGYVGVDLVEAAAGPVVLEVNPRVTTSYVGLSDATGHNVAQWVLQLAAGFGLRPQTLREGGGVDVWIEARHE